MNYHDFQARRQGADKTVTPPPLEMTPHDDPLAVTLRNQINHGIHVEESRLSTGEWEALDAAAAATETDGA